MTTGPGSEKKLEGIDFIESIVGQRLARMNLTKGARFEAARRHKFAARASNYSIVILSVWIFTISVLTLVYSEQLDASEVGYFSALTLILSFFVIAFSLLQSAKRHEIRSELFLKCGHDIEDQRATLERDWTGAKAQYGLDSKTDEAKAYEALVKLMTKDFYEVDEQYHKILSSFPDNHSDMDFHIWRFKSDRNPRRIQNRSSKWVARFERAGWLARRYFYTDYPLLMALALPLMAIVFHPNIEALFELRP